MEQNEQIYESLAGISKELRTPLNALLGLNFLMKNHEEDSEKLHEYLEKSELAINYLLSLVDEMSNLEAFENGKVAVNQDAIVLENLISSLDSIIAEEIKGTEISYTSRTDLIAPCIKSDDFHIRQILISIIHELAKAKKGNITLNVEQQDEEDGLVNTAFVVQDDQYVKDEKFFRVGKKGASLNLTYPVLENLAHALNGTLSFEEGVFTLNVKAPMSLSKKAAPLPEKKAEVIKKKEKHILIADDNELLAEILLEIVEEAGYKATIAKNGKEALDLFTSSKENDYDLIFMDMTMPVMDGCEATKEIRKLDREDAKKIVIYAFTASSSNEDKKKALDAGMNDFIVKPIDGDVLLEKIANC